MKTVYNLYQQLQHKEFDKAYPQYTSNEISDTVKVLYVAPLLNASGYYRMILPLLELNQTNSHSAIATDIRKWNFAKSFDEELHHIDMDLIAWSDYIVLPPMFMDLYKQDSESRMSFIDEVKSHNQDVQLVMDIDSNFHAMPKEHPSYRSQHPLGDIQARKENLLKNLATVDVVTGPTEELLAYYDRLIDEFHPESNVRLEVLPNLISHYSYENLAELKYSDQDKLRVAIVGNYGTYFDQLEIIDVLKHLSENYQDQIEIILFGWNGKHKNGINYMEGIKFDYVPSVNFVDYQKNDQYKPGYFTTLNELELDIVMLPMKDIPFNRAGKSPVKYFELASMHIAVIASDVGPYNNVIEDGVTGLLASSKEEWIQKLELLIEDNELRNDIRKNAFRHVWKNYSYTSRNLETVQDIFL